MAAYTRQGDFVALLLSKAEAKALRDLANYADHALAEEPENGSTKSARNRALDAINAACNTSARSGARFD